MASPPSQKELTSDPLSIVHVTTFYPPHTFGGDGVQVQRLAQALARRGHEVSVVYAPGAFALLRPGTGEGYVDIGHQSGDAASVTVHPLDGAGGRLEAILVQQFGRPVLFRGELRRLLEEPDGLLPDVIHFHNVSLIGGLGVLTMGHSIKLYTPHEYWLMCPTHLLFRYNKEICQNRTCIRCTLQSRRPPQIWRSTTSLDRYVSEIDSFVFPSHLTEAIHRERGIESPGLTIHHFLPDSYVAAAGARGARRSSAERFFLYVGRMDEVKGVGPLVSHFARSSGPAPLYLAGDGPMLPMLKERYGKNPSIRFLGRLDPEDLGKLYRDTIAVILPSAGYEVLGLVVLEGFAHATPAIVTRVAGAGELIEASGAGFVYDSSAQLDAALLKLANNSCLRSELGQRGLSYVREVHAEGKYMTRYEDLIRELRDQGPSSRL
jgi:glycosyltransferase involved in cell wall biosynthesis